jgi:acyl-CoA dehydrogenase
LPRPTPAAGTRGITAFIVDADNPGPGCSEHIAVMAPHPLATLQFQRTAKVPASAQLGEPNGGFKLAMQTLDIFRASVAGAALGMARRAWPKRWPTQSSPMFGQRWPTFQLTQAKLGEMAALVDAPPC